MNAAAEESEERKTSMNPSNWNNGNDQFAWLASINDSIDWDYVLGSVRANTTTHKHLDRGLKHMNVNKIGKISACHL